MQKLYGAGNEHYVDTEFQIQKKKKKVKKFNSEILNKTNYRRKKQTNKQKYILGKPVGLFLTAKRWKRIW